MATGTEMMINMAIKALGFNPEEIKTMTQTYANMIAEKVQNFDLRLTQMEDQNAQLIAQNEKFIKIIEMSKTTA